MPTPDEALPKPVVAVASHGFGPPATSAASPGLGAVAVGLAGVLPGCFALLDALRFAPSGQRPSPVLLTAPATAFALGLTGALLAAASAVLRQSHDGQPIPDAAAFAGLLGGVLAFGFSALWFVLAGGLAVMHSTALCLVDVGRGRLRFRHAVRLAGLLVVLCVLLGPVLPSPAGLAALLAPLLGVLAGDALLRRGRLVLEEVYLSDSRYGRLAGFSPAGLVSLCAAGSVWLGRDLLAALPGVRPGEEVAVVALVSLLVAAATQVLAGAALAAVSRAPRRSPPSPTPWDEPRALDEASTTQGLDRPRLVPQPSEDPTRAQESDDEKT